jgi:phosphopantetheinyl transferase
MSYYIGLSILSSSRIKKVQREYSSAEARRILSLLYEAPIGEEKIATETGGRPFFPEEEVDFNITHHGAVTAVSFVKGANLRTGCDIEYVRPRAGAAEIAQEYFSNAEKKYLFDTGKFDETKFYEIWTLKECFLKLRGLSVFDIANVPSFISCDASQAGKFAFETSVSLPLSFRLYELTNGKGESYIFATVIEGSQQLPEIKWFSQSVLSFDWKMRAEINAAPNPAQTVSPKR